MSENLNFDVSWLPQSYGPPSISATAANLTIRVGDQVATRNEDEWSKTIENSARVALYPLALWLAGCWWRLRWESEPSRSSPGPDWRMTHEFGAAGYGFLWPNLTLASDSQSIQVVGRPTPPLSGDPVRFLANFVENIPAKAFERAIDDLVELVLARLRAVGLENSDLDRLWGDVRKERRDPEVSILRRFEATFGFDPEEAPEDLLNHMVSLSGRVGHEAAEEIAPACAGPDPAGALNTIEEIASLPGIKGSEAAADGLREKVFSMATRMSRPWQQGRALAHAVRVIQGWNGQPLDDESVASLLGIRGGDLQPTMRVHKTAWTIGGTSTPGLAVRESSDDVRLHFRKRNRAGLRFEAARFLCDELIAPKSDKWLPATDSRTSRQRVQRAFAAEFLCPIQSLDDFLLGDYSQERIEDAAEYFGISPLAVSSHLANNSRISSLHSFEG